MAEENAKLMMKLLQKLPKRPVTSTKSANKSVVIKQPKSFAEMHALTKSNPRKSRSNNLPKPYTPESLSKKPRHSDDCARDSPSPSNVQAIVKSTTTPISPGKSLEPKRKLTSLQEKMAAKLEGSRFRFINEQLYKTTGTEALQSFKEDPELFDIVIDALFSIVLVSFGISISSQAMAQQSSGSCCRRYSENHLSCIGADAGTYIANIVAHCRHGLR